VNTWNFAWGGSAEGTPLECPGRRQCAKAGSRPASGSGSAHPIHSIGRFAYRYRVRFDRAWQPLPDHPDRSKSPTLSDRNQSFEEARADFEAAWQVFLSKRTEADFQAWLDQRDWTARKYALWDAGKRLEPSPRGTCQTVDSISQRGSPTPTAAHGTMGSGVNAARHES
jgi:hypothetical protein